MKRRSKKWCGQLAVLILCGIFCCGCSAETIPPEPEWILQKTECSVTLAGVEVRGTCSHTLEGLSSFTVEFPEEMAGMKVQYRQGQYTVQMERLTDTRTGGMMEESVFGRLFAALDSAAQAELTWQNGRWAGALPQGDMLTAESDDAGNPLSLTVPVWQLAVRFAQP